MGKAHYVGGGDPKILFFGWVLGGPKTWFFSKTKTPPKNKGKF